MGPDGAGDARARPSARRALAGVRPRVQACAISLQVGGTTRVFALAGIYMCPPAKNDVEARFLVRMVGDLINQLVTLNNHLAWQIAHELPKLRDALSTLTRTLDEAKEERNGSDR